MADSWPQALERRTKAGIQSLKSTMPPAARRFARSRSIGTTQFLWRLPPMVGSSAQGVPEYESTKIWDLGTVRELKNLHIFVQAFSSDGRWGASLDYRNGPKIILWDITSGQRVRTIALPFFNVSRVAFTPDGTRILATGPEIKFYETATGKEVQTLPIPASAVAFSGDGKWLAASAGSSVNIWDLNAGRALQTLARQLAAQDLVFSPSHTSFVTSDSALGLWDVASGKLVSTIPSCIQSLSYSPDGRWLATNP